MRKWSSLVILLILLTLPYSSASVLELSKGFMEESVYTTQEIPQKALLLYAMASTIGKMRNGSEMIAVVRDVADWLVSVQNPDGGWGHYPGSVSTPQDTALALIALHYVLNASRFYGFQIDDARMRMAVIEGEDYLLASFNEKGWGYVKGSEPAFYPTVLSLWALGELGFKFDESSLVESAVNYLNGFDITNPEWLALRLIAFHAVAYPDVSEDLKECRKLLNTRLNPLERAMLTYALVLYEPFGFETAKALSTLEVEGVNKGIYYLSSGLGPFSELDSITPTAYAVLAFSRVADVLSKERKLPVAKMCEALAARQNPDGGWPIERGESSPKATYYAVKALLSCSPSSGALIKAIEWARRELPLAMKNAENTHTVTSDFYYTAKVLASTSNLTAQEKNELITFTLSLSQNGLYTGAFGIPQPLETARGLDLLVSLGYSGTEIEGMKNWLLSITPGGWGIRTSSVLNLMVGLNVPTTVEVLEAISKVSTKEELAPHIAWLLSQRLSSGAWGYFKESRNILGNVYVGTPSFEYTVRVILLLKTTGFRIPDESVRWVYSNLDSLPANNIDLALSVLFLDEFVRIPAITLYDVISSFDSGKWCLCYSKNYNETAGIVLNVLTEYGVNVEVCGNPASRGNYVFLSNFSLNVSRYNSEVSVEKRGNLVVVNGRKYPSSSTVVIVPGRTMDGYVLMFLFEKDSSRAVELIFKSGMFKYLHGKYLVLGVSDLNGDGTVTPDEIELLDAG